MVSAFAVSTGGKLGALLAGSCSPTSPSSPSSYYLLHVPEISSMKQGHWQESHTYFFCTSSQSSAAWKWLVVFFFIVWYGLADTTEKLPALHGGWLWVHSVITVLFAWKYSAFTEQFSSTNSIIWVLKSPKALPGTLCQACYCQQVPLDNPPP